MNELNTLLKQQIFSDWIKKKQDPYDKGLIFRIYDLLQHRRQQPKEGREDFNSHFSKDNIQMTKSLAEDVQNH